MKNTKKKLKKSNNVISNSLVAYSCSLCSTCPSPPSCTCSPTTNMNISAGVRASAATDMNNRSASMINPWG